jgi:hypothetical protein
MLAPSGDPQVFRKIGCREANCRGALWIGHVAHFPSAPVSNIGHHAAMPQADAKLVDHGKIRRFLRSGDFGFSLQRSDQNKLNNRFFDKSA